MCAPAAAVAPIALGAANFGVGALGAVGSHQSQQAQAAAQNQAALNNYKYRNQLRAFEYMGAVDDYRFRKNQFNEQVYQNNLAASRAYSKEQIRMNELLQQAAFSNQTGLIELMRSQGQFDTTGRSGKSIDRLESARLGEYGRQQAGVSAMLGAARRGQISNNEDIRLQQADANRKAYGSLAITPKQTVASPPPVMRQGPSSLGLATGLLGAATSGLQTYDKFSENGLFGQK